MLPIDIPVSYVVGVENDTPDGAVEEDAGLAAWAVADVLDTTPTGSTPSDTNPEDGCAAENTFTPYHVSELDTLYRNTHLYSTVPGAAVDGTAGNRDSPTLFGHGVWLANPPKLSDGDGWAVLPPGPVLTV